MSSAFAFFLFLVGRYSESVNCADRYQNVLILNKGSCQTLQTRHRAVLDLPNVGKEPHSFYHFLFENYPAILSSSLLPFKYFVFLHGNPYDHAPLLDWELAHLDSLDRDEKFGTLACAKFLKLLNNSVLLCHVDKGCYFNRTIRGQYLPLCHIHDNSSSLTVILGKSIDTHGTDGLLLVRAVSLWFRETAFWPTRGSCMEK